MSEDVKVSKSLSIKELIFTECSKRLINIKTNELITRDHIGDINFYQLCGGRPLQRALLGGKPVKIFKTTYKYVHGKRYSNRVHVETLSGFNLIAKNLSLILPVTGDEVRKLLVPYLKSGSEKIMVAPLCGVRNLPPMTNPDLSFSRWSFRNVWVASGNMESLRDRFTWINAQLKKLGSDWRVVTGSLNLGVARYGKEVEELRERLARLEKEER